MVKSIQSPVPRCVLLTVALLAAAPVAAQTPVPTVIVAPTTAQSAGAAVDMPDVTGRFEHPGIPLNTFQYSPTWAPWTMGNGTGIAANGSGFTSANPDAPEGIRVAFLQGMGAMSTPYTFMAGTWRLRFYGAQRLFNGVNRQVVRVTITTGAGTTEVFEEELSGIDYVIYTTRAMTFASATNATVTFAGLNPHAGDNTAFVDQVEAEPISDWNNPASWDMGVPGAGSNAVIPAGVEVYVSGPANAATISCYGELLTTFASADITTRWLMVSGGEARFEVGRELTPFEQDFDLYLIGDDPTEKVLDAGTKFLMAMDGGQIDMHGRPSGIALPDGRERSWTRLAATASPASNQITVTDAVPWQQNDQIVIAGSNSIDPNNYVSEAEVVTVQSVAGNVVTLTAPPANVHYGAPNPLTYGNASRSWTLERRAEVGLLSHNVRIEGKIGTRAEFGGHVMMMKGPCCTSQVGGRGRFSSVEFYRLGQKLELGRYPIHWHMQHDQGDGQYVRNSSIYKSFNRAVTIHGSEHVEVEGIVAHDHVGHGIFFEDGSERFNKLYHNLALTTIKPPPGQGLLPSDNSHDEFQNRTPATYWITNPHNELVGNVAAGTQGTGFWFIFPRTPTGLSGDPNKPYYSGYFAGLEPIKETILKFEDNLCHSSSNGFDVNDGIHFSYQSNPNPPNHTIRTNDPWLPAGAANQYIEGLTVYGAHTGLYSGFGAEVYERVRFRENVLADNRQSIAFAAYNVLEDSAVIARTNAVPLGFTTAYVVYDGPGRVFDSHFDGFTSGFDNFLGDVGAATRHTGHRFRGLSFNPAGPPFIALADYNGATPNCTLVHDLQEPRRWGIALVDEDGTLSGNAGWTVISNHEMMTSLVDAAPANWSNAFASPLSFGHLRFYHPGLDSPCPPYVHPMLCNLPDLVLERHLSSHPVKTFLNCYKTDRHKQFPMVVNPAGWGTIAYYEATWPGGLPSTQEVHVQVDDLQDFADQTSAVVFMNGIGNHAATLQVKYPDNTPVQQFGSLQLLEQGQVTGYYVDQGAGTLWLRVVKTSGLKLEEVRITW